MRTTTFWINTAVVILFLAIGGHLLLAEPIIGLADHGDYFRVMGPVGLAFADPDPARTEFWYVQRDYDYVEPSGGLYTSSEEWLIQAAIFLDNLITKDLQFSLLFAGLVHLLAMALALGIILFSLKPIYIAQRITLGMMLILFLCDVGYLAWYNSLYSEPALQIFLFFSIGFAFALIFAPSGWRKIAAASGYYLAVMALLLSKPQAGPAGIVLAPLGMLLIIDWERFSIRGLLNLIPAAAILVLSAALLLRGQPDYMREANLYNIVFGDLLKNSPTPEEDMNALGIDPQFAPLIGLTIYDNANPVVDSPEFRSGFYDNIGYGSILRFYARNPMRFYHLAHRCARSAWSVRPLSMGNYEEKALDAWDVTDEYKSGGVPIQTHAFELWSAMKGAFLPRHILFILIFLGLNAAFGLATAVRRRHEASARSFAFIHIALVLLAIQQYLIAIIGEGEVSIIKHLYPFHVLFDLVLIWDVVWLAGWLQNRMRRRMV